MKQLEQQNNGESWRDCEAAGLRHQLGPHEEVRPAFGSGEPTGRTVRRCRRCPVSFMYGRG